MSQFLKALVVFAIFAVAPASVMSQDEVITLDGARIRGNQEAPLVLYLVPWKPPEARSLARPDEELMLERPMRPLERSEFRRLLGYHRHFQAGNQPRPSPE
jgi:hypothetical protein